MNKKVGLQPGSLIYTGIIDKNIDIPITQYFYNNQSFNKVHFIYKEDFKINLKKDFKTWINIEGIHNIDLIKKIGEKFKIDSLILEDLLNNSQRPKLEVRENFIFITLKMITHNKVNDKYECEQVSFILFKDLLLSFQEKSNNIFDNIKLRIENHIGIIADKNEDYLLYALIDRIVDNYFLITEDLEEKIQNLEIEISSNPTKKAFENILLQKKELLKIKKSIFPLRELVSKFSDIKVREFIKNDINIYLIDLQDHIIVINENIDFLFNRQNDLIQLYHSTLSNNMNEIMKVLAMISTIFIPLSFLAGVYGMNFQFMPELTWKYGYFIILIIMFIIFAGSILFFKKKKWW
ncbi:magnesium/cobalt transporter CorA [Fusobacterium perfoetens]|uniref:magnesium/cobalt transporter CorA n=1 Tax=Fusobacterium perfoetens TaxID=852 RepID=UPI0004881E90|nr:magnesium/cobalt transporter CorA [Fusobacterium perfoetens]MCI6152322.1 magnesium/cobalt transporter CorA [Fusobacterium perfoetens]MDY3238180.1 magnesium/cobalt transporter CorA [Fusobacterium perfoetens]